MTVLVDVNVLSEATKPEPDPRILNWLTRHEREIAVDPMILGEIRFGVLLLPTGKRRAKLERWFEDVVECIHCLEWDSATGLRWAQLLVKLRTSGRSMPIKDSLIAATALVHRIPIATRNRRDFENAGVEIVDPLA